MQHTSTKTNVVEEVGAIYEKDLGITVRDLKELFFVLYIEQDDSGIRLHMESWMHNFMRYDFTQGAPSGGTSACSEV